MSQTILVVGSINTDLVTVTERLPAAGETVMAQTFALLPGGKGANQAVAITRLGGKAVMVGRVGDDPFGQTAVQRLDACGVDTKHVTVTPGVASGVATILVEAGGANRILVVSGANACVVSQDVPQALLDGAALVVMQLEIPIDT